MIHEIPELQYGYVRNVTKSGRVVPAVWYGIVCIPGRVIGLNVMLECGATYRNVPPWNFSFEKDKKNELKPTWDCYWIDCKIHRYQYLIQIPCAILDNKRNPVTPFDCDYLFSIKPYNDIFSPTPEQDKEYYFVRYNQSLTYIPNNEALFMDKSFTETDFSIINKIKRNKEIYAVE